VLYPKLRYLHHSQLCVISKRYLRIELKKPVKYVIYFINFISVRIWNSFNFANMKTQLPLFNDKSMVLPLNFNTIHLHEKVIVKIIDFNYIQTQYNNHFI
jgi:hypothetical protein